VHDKERPHDPVVCPPWPCAHRTHHAAAGAVSALWPCWRQVVGADTGWDGTAFDGRRFMAISGMLMSILFLFGIVLPWISVLFVGRIVGRRLLVMVAAPLFVLSAPLPELWFGIAARRRGRLAHWWHRARTARRALMLVTAPGPVFVLHAVAIWFWHFRGPYEA